MKQHDGTPARMDLEASKRIVEMILNEMLGYEVDVYAEVTAGRGAFTGILRKVYGECDEHGMQIYYVYDSKFSSRSEGTVTFSAHDVEHLGAHYSSITLRKVQ